MMLWVSRGNCVLPLLPCLVVFGHEVPPSPFEIQLEINNKTKKRVAWFQPFAQIVGTLLPAAHSQCGFGPYFTS